MKLTAFALIGMIMSTAATAQTVAPFESDGCVPGFNAQGQFIDEKGYVLDSAGWVATADQKVLNAAGQQVFLKKTCLGRLAKVNGNMGVALGLGVLVAALAAGSTSSTNDTN